MNYGPNGAGAIKFVFFLIVIITDFVVELVSDLSGVNPNTRLCLLRKTADIHSHIPPLITVISRKLF